MVSWTGTPPPRTPTGRVGWAAAVPGALDRRVTRSFPALVLNQVQATDVRAANGSHAGCRRASAPVHAAPGAPGCPPNEELMSVSARRHPVVEGRDGHTQGRNADEGFRRRSRATGRSTEPPLHAPVDQWKHGKAGRNSSQAAPAHFSPDSMYVYRRKKPCSSARPGSQPAET